jgi:hypothetical protein
MGQVAYGAGLVKPDQNIGVRKVAGRCEPEQATKSLWGWMRVESLHSGTAQLRVRGNRARGWVCKDCPAIRGIPPKKPART